VRADAVAVGMARRQNDVGVDGQEVVEHGGAVVTTDTGWPEPRQELLLEMMVGEDEHGPVDIDRSRTISM